MNKISGSKIEANLSKIQGNLTGGESKATDHEGMKLVRGVLFGEVVEEINEEINNLKKSLSNKIKNTDSDTNEKIKSLESRINDSIDAYKSDNLKKDKFLEKILKEYNISLSEINDKTISIKNDFQDLLMQRFNELHAKIDKISDDINNRFIKSEKNIQDKFISKKDLCGSLLNLVNKIDSK